MTAPVRPARPATQAERAGATKARLIAVARTMFAARGFARTTSEEIVAAAQVTRGALYHHFAGKEGLFEAAFLAVQTEIGERIAEASAAAGPDRWPRLLAGCRAFLRAASEPDVRQIVLIDAPAVLGAEAWRLADERHATLRLRRALHELNAERGDRALDVEATTVLINGALNDAALWIARSDDPAAAYERAAAAFDALTAALAPPGTAQGRG